MGRRKPTLADLMNENPLGCLLGMILGILAFPVYFSWGMYKDWHKRHGGRRRK